MIYTPMTCKAMRVAYEAHHGQMDKGGVPYVFHPIHVAEQMTDELSACVALLHDVAEDTAVTLEEIETEFPVEVAEAVRLLTRDKNKDYFDYIREIKQNYVALRVKLADLAHNCDETRLVCGDGSEVKEMLARREKYRRARAILEE